MSVKRLSILMLCLILLAGALPAFPAPAARAATEEEHWKTLPYWIGVDTKNQRTTIYRTADNSVAHCWICSTGAGKRQTPLGTFYLPPAKGSERQEWFAFAGAYVKYAVCYTKGLYFHSTLFTKKNREPMQSSIDKLGRKASHGCIRLPVPAARWLCYNCPTGTRAIMHNGVNDPRIVEALGHEAGTTRTPMDDLGPEVDSVSLDRTGTLTLGLGDALQLHAFVEPQSASAVLTWTSSKAKVATVDDNGLVKGVGKGVATISVTANGCPRASVKVNVVDLYAPTAVSLDYSGTVTLNVGDALQLKATLAPETARSDLTWSSGKSKVAAVSAEGLVTAKAKGVAKITVKTRNGKSAFVRVKVVDPFLPTGVRLDRTGTVELKVGDTLQLTATLAPETAVSDLTWKSSKPGRAAVDGNGRVTALAAGTAKITVRTRNGKTARVTIRVVR